MKVENFFGETLRFSKFSTQQVGESLASKIRRVSTPGSHGSSNNGQRKTSLQCNAQASQREEEDRIELSACMKKELVHSRMSTNMLKRNKERAPSTKRDWARYLRTKVKVFTKLELLRTIVFI